MKIRAVSSSLTAAGMTAVLALKAHGRIEDAAKIEQILLANSQPPTTRTVLR